MYMRPHMLPAAMCVSAYTACGYISSVLTYRAVYMLHTGRAGANGHARALSLSRSLSLALSLSFSLSLILLCVLMIYVCVLILLYMCPHAAIYATGRAGANRHAHCSVDDES